MTSLYMPDVVVEIAFDSGYAEGESSRTWTDVSAYVELEGEIPISFGRSDERGSADANTVSLTLDNSDGRFTPGYASGAYYPNVLLGRPIRVSATRVGGTSADRFTGFVDEWPVVWPNGTEDYSSVTITASSRLSRLGLDTARSQAITEEYLADSPAAYWPMSDPSGSTTAADVSGSSAPNLVSTGSGPALTFGEDSTVPTSTTSGVAFSGGNLTGVYLSAPSFYPGGETVGTIAGWFSTSSAPSVASTIASINGSDLVLYMNTTGTLTLYSYTFTVSTSGSYADGAAHHFVVDYTSSTSSTLWIDGALIGVFAHTPTYTYTASTVNIGYDGYWNGRPGHFSGQISHVAAWPLSFTPTTAMALRWYKAGAAGTSGLKVSEAAAQIAGWAGIPDSELSFSGETRVRNVPTDGVTVLGALQVLETTEQGALFDDVSGVTTLLPRSGRYVTTPFVIDVDTDGIGSDYSPRLDRTGLVNIVEASNIDGTVTTRAEDSTSRDTYGIASLSITTAALSPDGPSDVANWNVESWSTPFVRVATMSLDLLTFSGADQDSILDLTIGSSVTVTNHPAQAPGASATYFVEGYSETIGPESWDIVFNLSPSEPYASTLILDESGRDVLGTNNLAL